MKTKLLGIFVCMLLIATALPAVGSMIASETNNDINPETKIQYGLQPVTITRPAVGNLYLFDTVVIPIGGTTLLIIGRITLQAQAQPNVALVMWQVNDLNGVCNHDWNFASPPNFAQLYSGYHFPFFNPPFYTPSITITAFAYDATGILLGSQTINAIKIL